MCGWVVVTVVALVLVIVVGVALLVLGPPTAAGRRVAGIRGVEGSPPDRDQFEAFETITLGPKEHLDVRTVGQFACPNQNESTFEVLSLYETIPVDYRMAGVVPRTTEIEVGHRLGWTTSDTEELTDDLVTRIPPRNAERR